MLDLIQRHSHFLHVLESVIFTEKRNSVFQVLQEISAAVWMFAAEAVKDTEFANEHTGKVWLVVLLSVILKYCKQETGAGS